MTDARRPFFVRAARRIRAQFFVGILFMVPLGATVLVLIWVFNRVDNILRPVITFVWGKSIPGIGFGATIVLIYLAGVIGSSLIGRRLVRFWESLLHRLPVVRPIYQISKQILEGFSGSAATGFKQVVLIDYPRKDVKSIAFVTNEFYDRAGKKFYNVFVPTSPNVTSGYLRIMGSEEVTRTTLSVDDAIKMLVSLGRTAPDGLGEKMG